jgi:hypothetical protein
MGSFHPSPERINRTEMITPLSSTWRRNFHRNFFHNAAHWPAQCLSTGVFRGAGAGLIMTGDGRYCAGWRGTMPPVVYPVLQGSGRKFRPEGAGRSHERPPVPANGSGQAPVSASLYPGNLVRRRGSLNNAPSHLEWCGYQRTAGTDRRQPPQQQSPAPAVRFGPRSKRTAAPDSLWCELRQPYPRCGRREVRLEKCRANCANTMSRDGNRCSFSITGILQSLVI